MRLVSYRHSCNSENNIITMWIFKSQHKWITDSCLECSRNIHIKTKHWPLRMAEHSMAWANIILFSCISVTISKKMTENDSSVNSKHVFHLTSQCLFIPSPRRTVYYRTEDLISLTNQPCQMSKHGCCSSHWSGTELHVWPCLGITPDWLYVWHIDFDMFLRRILSS